MLLNDRDQIIAMTAEWTGERYPNGRPRVSDEKIEILKNLTQEEIWQPLYSCGYRFQFQGDLKPLHPDKKLYGRAVTCCFMPQRPDLRQHVFNVARSRGWKGDCNQWVIDSLEESDVVVCDLYDKILRGTFVGGNLTTAVKARTKNGGVVVWGGVRDLEQMQNIDVQVFYTCTLVDDPAQADFALLFVSPSSGEYFNATPGYLELDICEDKTVCNVDANGKPMADTHTETTLHGGKRLTEIAASVHANGGKVITNVNITLAWQLGNVEPLCDVLLAGFDTYRSATLDAIFGCFAPTGKLPLTLPRGDAVLAVNADGVCISPNDVPGYDKDRYMPDSLKDENGKAYAYRDAAGNYYEYGFGLEG